MKPPVIGPELEHRPELPTKQSRREDVKFAAGKIAFFQYSAVAIFLFLILGFWNLQVQNPQIYNEQAERNSIKQLPIPAPRGKILDRDGRVIVDNHSSYGLILRRENLKLEHLRTIAEGLDLDYDDLVAKVNRWHSSRQRAGRQREIGRAPKDSSVSYSATLRVLYRWGLKDGFVRS